MSVPDMGKSIGVEGAPPRDLVSVPDLQKAAGIAGAIVVDFVFVPDFEKVVGVEEAPPSSTLVLSNLCFVADKTDVCFR